MGELQNGELLREIFDTVKNIEVKVAVIANEQESQAKLIDRNYEDIEKIKWKVLPMIGVISILGALIIAWLKR